MTGKKKKPAAPNAFIIFAREFQANQRDIGRILSLPECTNICGDMWTKLPPEDKLIYQNMANEAKHRIKAEKFTSKGEAVQKIHQRHLQVEEDLKMMNDAIQSTIEVLDQKSTLLTKTFHLLHINYFCKTDTGNFVPAEMALVEFNLLEGVKRVVHTFIDADQFFFEPRDTRYPPKGGIPTGYRSSAMEHCNDTHRTPLNLKHDGKSLDGKGPEDLLTLIINTLKPGSSYQDLGLGELPPIYTMPDEVNRCLHESCIKSVLEYLCDEYELPHNTFKIFNIAKLFFELRNVAGQPFPTLSLALNILEKDVFKYTSGIACDFHEEEDVSAYCSRSIVQRWVYVICDHVCQYLDIGIRPGFHCPKNADLQGAYRSHIPSAKGIEPKDTFKGEECKRAAKPKREILREPRACGGSRASSCVNSETSSVRNSRASSVTLEEGQEDLDEVDAKPMMSAGWGEAGGGWNRVVSCGNEAPSFDYKDDFPSIGATGYSRGSSHNQRSRGGRGGSSIAAGFSKMRLE